MKKRYNYYLILLVAFLFFSCDSDWLDVKRDQKMVVPQTLKDLQALLDNTSVFNIAKSPSVGEISADDISIQDSDWLSTNAVWQKNAYLWESDIFNGIPSSSNGWDLPYRQVFYANVVLETLSKNKFSEQSINQQNEIQGAALFWRSWAFYQLTQIFCVQYDNKASLQLGIPLPLEPDVLIKYKRSTLEESYSQILSDLELASSLLPAKTMYPTQPSKTAAYGLLARAYLQKGDYAKSYHYADIAYSTSKGLVDYRLRDQNLEYPFEQFNQEVILESSMEYYENGILAESKLLANTALTDKYEEGDLRMKLFFSEGSLPKKFKGSYTGNLFLFSGISTNEIYLIKMESAARTGRKDEALTMLNFFLKMRFEDGLYTERETVSLDDILLQRRLELPFRGLRWTDIKRLNMEGHKIVLERKVQAKTYTLPSNSTRYVIQIPPEVIVLNPSIVQNQRE